MPTARRYAAPVVSGLPDPPFTIQSMTTIRLRSSALAGALTLLVTASMLSAQTQVTVPPIDFSGVIYSNFQYRTDSRAKDFNKFDIERIYLTFRMPAGDRAAIRVTTDVFQQQNTPADAYYAGWAVRIKYGYLQYNYLSGKPTNFTAVVCLRGDNGPVQWRAIAKDGADLPPAQATRPLPPNRLRRCAVQLHRRSAHGYAAHGCRRPLGAVLAALDCADRRRARGSEYLGGHGRRHANRSA